MCCASLLLVALGGCSGTAGAKNGGSAVASSSASLGSHMAGPAVDVHVDQSVVAAQPKPADLKTPQSAVRSYLDWTTYGYRIGQSSVSAKLMGADEGVRVDSYIQYNLEKKRLLGEKLVSLTLGTPSSTSTATLVPAKESWTYSYLSIDNGNKVLSGPYTANYDSTYKLTKSGGHWIVDSVAAKAIGTVK